MKNRSSHAVLTRFGIIAAILAALVFIAPVASAADLERDYDENDTVPVASLSATDEDGDAIEWSLDGADKGKFDISDTGVLTFKSPPDFEDQPKFDVTVKANAASFEVVVNITNLDELGSVSLDKPQPQAGRPLTATASDPDHPDGGIEDEAWQWARSMDGETGWMDIDKATSASRMPVAADVGYYLRASVTYKDMFAEGQTASEVTEKLVEAKTTANAAPSFADHDSDGDATNDVHVTLSIEENAEDESKVGKRPLTASDADNDVLLYSIVVEQNEQVPPEDTSDYAKFDIDPRSGQLKVAAELNFETPDSAAGGTGTAYTVTIKATDPSGASGEATVTINLMDVNELPVFEDDQTTTLYIPENDDDPQLSADKDNLAGEGLTGTEFDTAYTATDNDGDTKDSVPVYTLKDDLDGKFEIGNGVLGATTALTADFEKTPSYSVVIVATTTDGTPDADDDRGSKTAELAVTVKVVDGEDDGVVTIAQREPQINGSVTAKVEDEDEGVSRVEWSWERDTADGNDPIDDNATDNVACDMVQDGDWTAIDGAGSSSYTTKAADLGRCLRATATYVDNIEPEDDATTEDVDESQDVAMMHTERAVQAASPANSAPTFLDLDPNTEGKQNDAATRVIDENTDAEMPIGDAIGAEDSNSDLLIHTLGGADADSFAIDRKNGQLMTKAELNYEMKSTYMVMVTATDPSGSSANVPVTINVNDKDDLAVITGEMELEYAENDDSPVGSFEATDEDGDDIEWSLDGADKAKFDISDDGELTFKSPPDFDEGQETYSVTVKATGGELKVTVKIINLNEDGEVELSKPQPQVGRGLEASVSDPDSDPEDQTWRWARSMDGETGWIDIETSTSANRSPEPADAGYYLRATATYTDMFGEGQMASAVTESTVEDKTTANAAPSFSGLGDDDDDPTTGVQLTRSVAENSAKETGIGKKPLTASDTDSDVLLYSIVAEQNDDEDPPVDSSDYAKFTIEPRSGQLKVNADLDFEAPTTVVGGADNNAYVIKIRATDPSGATGDATVTINVTDVNESPDFGDDDTTTLYIAENDVGPGLFAAKADVDPEGTGVSDPYTATDDDGEKDGTPVFTLKDNLDDKFAITDGGVLSTTTALTADYEDTSSYSVVIVATTTDVTPDDDDRGSKTAELTVTVNVVDGEDPGEVTIAQREPQVGSSVTAKVEDEDGGVFRVGWSWERDTETGNDPTVVDEPNVACDEVDQWGAITGAGASSYTTKSADMGRCLRATATYVDNIEREDDAGTTAVDESRDVAMMYTERAVQAANAANTAPAFPDLDADTDGVQDEEVTRTVAENTPEDQSIGDAIEAEDANGDLLTHTLGGPDADSFAIDRKNGQLMTKADLDYETKNVYTVMIIATDPSGASDRVTVTINVTDEDDAPTITLRPAANVAPAFADDAVTDFTVDENMYAGAAVGMVEAIDEGDTLTYSDNSVYFDVDDMGNITTTMMLDHEAMDSHMVTITATDSGDATDTLDVTINVGDMHPDCPVNMGLTNDCEALLDAKDDLGGSLNWDTDTAMADWEGVRMSEGRVSEVWLKEKSLDGSVSAALGRLDMLTVLNLHTNMLTGPIPDLSGATMLEGLYLPNNDLTGGIPAWLNGSTNLTNLWLWGNQLTGGIPDLSALTSLDKLKLAGNMLDGNINAMYLPPNVTWLIIDSNGFDGVIPDLSGLTSLKLLWLHSNALTGAIPDGTMLPPNVDDLNLRDNMLSGEIPDLSALDMATRVRLHGNMLTGEVPASLGDLASLKQLWLWDNQLTSINAGLGDLSATLIEIGLNDNPWADDACVPIELADVATNDYGPDNIEVCEADDGS